MKKILNFRPLLFIFVALALAIRFTRDIFGGNVLIIILLSSLFILLVVCSIVQKKFVSLVCVVCSFCLGMGMYFYAYNNFQGEDYQGEVVVSSRINESLNIGYCTTTLTNCVVNGKSVKNISANIYVYTQMQPGDTIVFSAEIEKVKLFQLGDMNSYYYRNNVQYTANVDNYEYNSGSPSFSEKFKENVHALLLKNIGKEQAEIAFSVLFGDKSEIEPDTYSNFKSTGTAHILAVSGLHVGFLAGLIYFVLSKFRMPRWLQFLFTAIILILFCYLCGFTPSVVRATLMSLIFLSAGMFGKPYDLLSSTSLAGIILLLFKPLYIFDVGFLLSFFCVFSIALFTSSFTRMFVAIKFPRALASAFAIIISVQIGIFPFMANYFGSFSLLTIFANLVCVPLFALAYTMLVLFVLICLPLKFLGFLLFLPDVLFKTIVVLVGFFATMPILILYPMSSSIALIYFLIIFLVSAFVLLNKKVKASLLVVFLSAGFCFSFFPSKIIKVGDLSYVQLDNSNCSAVLCFSNGVVISFNPDSALTSKFLLKTDLEQDYYFKIKDKSYIIETNFISHSDIDVEIIRNDNFYYGVLISYKNYKVFYSTSEKLENFEILNLKARQLSVDVLFEKKDYGYSQAFEHQLLVSKDSQLKIDNFQIFMDNNKKEVRYLDEIY